MALDLKQDIFQPVLARVIKRSDSLRNVKRFHRTGIEGWLKVEIVAALGDRVTSLNNVGPDLTLADGTKIEIKAATDFNRAYVIAPLRKYGTPSLFLADGADPAKLMSGNDTDFEIVGLEVISDGVNDWLLGMVKPRIQKV